MSFFNPLHYSPVVSQPPQLPLYYSNDGTEISYNSPSSTNTTTIIPVTTSTNMDGYNFYIDTRNVYIPPVPSPFLDACYNVFLNVIAYCREEHVMPRECVFKARVKTLLAQYKQCSTFDGFIQALITMNSKVHVVGEQPLRTFWPTHSVSGPIEYFECVDFVNPKQQFTDEQMHQVHQYLLSVSRLVSKPRFGGRFGLAVHLRTHGPAFLCSLKLGYLLELIQLLYNLKLITDAKHKTYIHRSAFTKVSPTNRSIVDMKNNDVDVSAIPNKWQHEYSRIPKPIMPSSPPPVPISHDSSNDSVDMKIQGVLEILGLKHKYSSLFEEHQLSFEVWKIFAEDPEILHNQRELQQFMPHSDQLMVINAVKILTNIFHV